MFGPYLPLDKLTVLVCVFVLSLLTFEVKPSHELVVSQLIIKTFPSQ